MSTHPLRDVQKHGQSIWLDHIDRRLIMSGGLREMIEEEGLRGVTSNPSIFEEAIGGGDAYAGLIAALALLEIFSTIQVKLNGRSCDHSLDPLIFVQG